MTYETTSETTEWFGVTFHRLRNVKTGKVAGWLEAGGQLPRDTRAEILGDVWIYKDAASKFHGGKFHGGEFWSGLFHGGEFWSGLFHGGEFWGGVFHGGEFWGGVFWGGVFWGGKFWSGTFHDGVFHGGTFYDGVFHQSPCCAQRSDGYVFVAKYVGDDLRIWAGCRNFSCEEAVAHWNDDHKHGAESQRIIHFLKAQAEAEQERNQ